MRLYSFVLSVLLIVATAFLHPQVAMAQTVLMPGPGCERASESEVGDSMFHGRLTTPQIAYLTVSNESHTYVCRWNLERRDPNAASSDVVDPITYLIGTDVPQEWHPYIIHGVQEWVPIFDSLGFRNAIVVRVASAADSVTPPKKFVVIHKEEGESVSMEAGCYAIPSTGELKKCIISLHGGNQFSDAGRSICSVVLSEPTVPMPCPDSLLGRIFQVQLTHEVGHTLGLDHHFNAVSAYPTDSLRSAAFVRRWSSVSSVMSYAVYNALPQVTDHVPVSDRWTRVGPYDRFAIAWAYRPIPEAKTPEAELPTLAHWRSAQDTAAYLRLTGDAFNVEMATGNDYIKALEFLNGNRISLMQRRFVKDSAATLRLLAEGGLPRSWHGRLTTVADDYIGGKQPFPVNAEDKRYIPIDAEQQLRAVRFVLGYALYNQDTYLQYIDTIGGHRPTQPRHAVTDSVPFLFDTSATGHFPDAVAWQGAQQQVLENLVSSISRLPSQSVAEACRYLADAVRALTRADILPALQASAQTLRTTLAPPPVCRSP